MHFLICKVEKSFHIIRLKLLLFFFHNSLEECLIEPDPSKYFYVSQGMLTIDGVDDAEEMRLTDEAMDVLGFTKV